MKHEEKAIMGAKKEDSYLERARTCVEGWAYGRKFDALKLWVEAMTDCTHYDVDSFEHYFRRNLFSPEGTAAQWRRGDETLLRRFVADNLLDLWDETDHINDSLHRDGVTLLKRMKEAHENGLYHVKGRLLNAITEIGYFDHAEGAMFIHTRRSIKTSPSEEIYPGTDNEEMFWALDEINRQDNELNRLEDLRNLLRQFSPPRNEAVLLIKEQEKARS